MADIASASVSVVTRTVFGNKRVVIADVTFGDGSSTWPSGGFSLPASQFGLDAIELILFESKTLLYSYVYTTGYVNAYTANGSPGATALMVEAVAATPNESVRVIAIGYGG